MYAAIAGRDRRFDGVFYTAVSSTGIYCRPSCPARTPGRANVSFYRSAAAAQSAGFRACKRCVPEALPGTSLWDLPDTISTKALALIERGVLDEVGVEGLAARLGWSSRTIGRVMVEQTGATPLAHARARRARVAHGLITSTDESFSTIAFAAGFASIRQFNDTIRAVYDLNPTQIRGRRPSEIPSGTVRARLTYRPPLNWRATLRWYQDRVLPACESVTLESQTYRVALRLARGDAVAEVADDPTRGQLIATLHLADLRDYAQACRELRRILDLDADPVGIAGHLGTTLAPLLPDSWLDSGLDSGRRIPGTATPLEALLRALTGQQVSVASGRAQLVRLTGEPDPTTLRPFPDAATILRESGTDWFRGPEKRRATIAASLDLAASGGLDPTRDPAEVAQGLLAVPGIGPWTAAYTLLRGFGHPDVDLGGDLVVATMLRNLSDAPPTAVLARCAPWRSYAAMHLWALAAAPTTAPARSAGPGTSARST